MHNRKGMPCHPPTLLPNKFHGSSQVEVRVEKGGEDPALVGGRIGTILQTLINEGERTEGMLASSSPPHTQIGAEGAHDTRG